MVVKTFYKVLVRSIFCMLFDIALLYLTDSLTGMIIRGFQDKEILQIFYIFFNLAFYMLYILEVFTMHSDCHWVHLLCYFFT